MSTRKTRQIVDVSVIIPAYNSEDTLVRAVDSVQAQTHLPKEILIYDDASVDRTRECIEELAQTYRNVCPMFGAKNRGVGCARRALLEAATGQYFAFLDADDAWSPEKIERQLGTLVDGRADIVASAYEIKDASGTLLGIRKPPREVTYALLLLTNYIATSTAIVRADLVGARDMPLLRSREDYGYWIQLFKRNPGLRCRIVDEVLMVYERRAGSVSSSTWRNLRASYGLFRDVGEYSRVTAAALTLANAGVRIFRA
ncbi:MAG: glycosyltransferase family 2 protein [Pseudomonadota bacterium]